MPDPHPHVTVEAASLPADGKLGQDRHLIGDDFAIVLDGASGPTPSDRDGGWYAEALSADLAGRLQRSRSINLRAVLAHSIAQVAGRYDLQPSQSPSSTVAIARWDATHLHTLVLGDSPLIAEENTGGILMVRDDRLANIARTQRAAHRAALRRGGRYDDAHRQQLTRPPRDRT